MTDWPEFNRTEQFMLLENGRRVYRAIITEDQYNQARAAIAAMQWRPIETAPTDGTEVLGYCDGVIDKTWVEWFDNGKPVFLHSDWISFEPTHWMPLPPTIDR